ncbi:terminus macrodomain insulation protein YfbV [Testudinibacter sp. P80/BLE/0925]|uniref:terminus macrodomain insulation protein YfbV n=1 Tax=Testudinibacter sp. TW-1 TaxID=3417757 RepID=UPI003D36EB5C
MHLFTTFKLGQHYLETWPQQAKLGMIFPENRVIRAVRFAQKAMPAIAVAAIVWQQIALPGNQMALAAAVLTALFALSFPLQGLWWLGKRAQQPLAESAKQAYQKIASLLQQQQVYLILAEKPTFMDLAKILKSADKHLSADFWEEL